jgi:chitin disaccharide deacetylase
MSKHNLPQKRSRLVLHADDLGMNRAVSEGILRGFREGLLTSTSLLANAPDAGRALQQWKALLAEHAAGKLPSAAARARLDDPDQPFDLGVHLNLTQGRPLSGSYPAELLDSHGRFPGVSALFLRLWRYGGKFQAAIRAELERQIQLACDRGVQPMHLNGHQYIEMLPGVAQVMPELLGRFGIKTIRVAWEGSLWRSTVLGGQFWKWPMARVKRAFAERFRARMDALGVAHPDMFFGTVHAGQIDVGLMRRFVTAGKRSELVEIGLHPGETAESASPDDRTNGWHDPLAALRTKELQMLCSAELAALLESAGWRLERLAT